MIHTYITHLWFAWYECPWALGIHIKQIPHAHVTTITSRHTVVCQQPRKKEDVQNTSVLFTGTVNLANSAFCISKTTKPISMKFIYFLPYIYTTSHIKIEGNCFSTSWDICSWKLSNFLHIFLLLGTKLQIHLSCVKIIFPCFGFFQIWSTNNVHLGLHFPKILRNSNRKWGSYILYRKFFSQFVIASTGCIVNAMDLKIFPNHMMLLKVVCFEGFSNQSNNDELVINNMSGCNCKNYKLNNSLVWKQCFPILRTF